VSRVQDLIRKRNFPRVPDGRVLEDALCLVFLETQFAETTAKTGDEKMIGILQKTWRKMTPQAQQIALTISDDARMPHAGREGIATFIVICHAGSGDEPKDIRRMGL
jgi:6-phosphogluconate dehydrogenase